MVGGILQQYPGQLEPEREQLLADAGFAYNFDRGLFISSSLHKVISEEAAQDQPIEEIKEFIERPRPADVAIEFLFNGPVPDGLGLFLVRQLGWDR